YVTKYDWDGARRPLQRCQGGRPMGDEHVRPQSNQFCRGGTDTVRTGSEAIIDPDVATLYPSEFLQCLAYHCDIDLSGPKILSPCHKSPAQPHSLALLRPRHERPRRRRGAEEGEEVAALHGCASYSITSSVRASSVIGGSRPSAFAVLRLMTSWNLVANWTGK